MSKNKIFKIVETDDYGNTSGVLGLFYAEDRANARQIAAKFFNNKEIVTTGFYDARETSYFELEKMKAAALRAIERKTKILNKPLK